MRSCLFVIFGFQNIGVCDYADRVDCSKEPLIFSPRANFLSNVPKGTV